MTKLYPLNTKLVTRDLEKAAGLVKRFPYQVKLISQLDERHNIHALYPFEDWQAGVYSFPFHKAVITVTPENQALLSEVAMVLDWLTFMDFPYSSQCIDKIEPCPVNGEGYKIHTLGMYRFSGDIQTFDKRVYPNSPDPQPFIGGWDEVVLPEGDSNV